MENLFTWRQKDNKLVWAFLKFHRSNPKVWELFEKFTQQVIAAGRKHYSAKAVFERIRWHTNFETTGDSFKLSNNHTAFYARVFHLTHPQAYGFFRTHEQPSGDNVEEILKQELNL